MAPPLRTNSSSLVNGSARSEAGSIGFPPSSSGGGGARSSMSGEGELEDDELQNSNGPWPVTADNLGRIPEAEQLAPGIRLPNTVAHGVNDDEDDEENEYRSGVPTDNIASRRNIGPTHVGHFGAHGAPVHGVPPELDPRAAKFRRPTSPGAASVFSLAVQPPASPKHGPMDSESHESGAFASTPSTSGAELPALGSRSSFSLPSPSVTSSAASIFSGPPSASIPGGMGTPTGAIAGSAGTGVNPFMSSLTGSSGMLPTHGAGVAASVAATAGSASSASSITNSRPSSIRAPSPPLSVVSAPGSDVSMGPPSATTSSAAALAPSYSAGSGTQFRTSGYQAGPSMLSRQAALASHAPSEVGSVDTSSSLDAPLSSGGGGVGSTNGDAMDTESDVRRADDEDEGEPDGGDFISRRAKTIERQRMRERELMGGEAGVGGLSRAPVTPSLAALMRQDRTVGGYGSGGLLSPSRPGSTAATIGTASPPASTASSSDDGHGLAVSSRRHSAVGREGSIPGSPVYGHAQMQTPPLRPSPAFAFGTGPGSSAREATGSSGSVDPGRTGGTRGLAPVVQGEMADFAHRSRRSSIESTETIASSSHQPATTSSGASDRGGPEGWPVGTDIVGGGGAAAGVPVQSYGHGYEEAASVAEPDLASRRLEETLVLDGPQIGFGKPETPTGEERMQF